MPSICFVVTSPAMVHLAATQSLEAMGGAEIQIWLIARFLREAGWNVSLIVGDYGQDQEIITDNGIRVLRSYPRKGKAARLAAPVHFWSALTHADADVCVVRGLTGLSAFITAWSRTHKRSSLLWVANNMETGSDLSFLSRSERLIASWGRSRISAMVTQTKTQQARLSKSAGRDSTVIPNICPHIAQNPISGQDGPLLWLGSIQPKKRPHLLLDIAEKLPDLSFVMAGGAMKKHQQLYSEIAERSQRMRNVEYLGFVPYERTLALLEQSSMLVSTSVADAEGFPNVLLQAWGLGLPTVATVDPDQIAQQHDMGYYCEDADAMASSLRHLAYDHEMRLAKGLNAYRYVRAYHTVDAIGEKLTNLLLSLLPSGRRDFAS
jgi:glycosyltransferase involved in cell wall biosynthesis